MITSLHKHRSTLPYRILSGFIAFTFIFSLVLPPGYAQLIPASPAGGPQTLLNLPAPGVMVTPSAAFTPTLIKGLTIHPGNPLEFDFVVEKGDNPPQGEEFNKESMKLVKYFLASLTVPEDQMWVNLSPYEKDRIISENLGVTEMGKDMLAQDYILKQLTASLMYPENELGKKFWDRIYKKAYEQYGTTEIPMDTFNKVWIVPDKAVVYEHEGSVFVVESHLKVMLENDYKAMGHQVTKSPSHKDNAGDVVTGDVVTTGIIREVIIPAIEQEVNEGKTFANLRQIYNSMILATWYKKNLRESLLGQVYVDKGKTRGVDLKDPQVNQKIYEQYIEAFKKGVYNYIKEDYDPATKEIVPRKYFSGGAVGLKESSLTTLYRLPAPQQRAIIDAFKDIGNTPGARFSNLKIKLYEIAEASKISEDAMTEIVRGIENVGADEAQDLFVGETSASSPVTAKSIQNIVTREAGHTAHKKEISVLKDSEFSGTGIKGDLVKFTIRPPQRVVPMGRTSDGTGSLLVPDDILDFFVTDREVIVIRERDIPGAFDYAARNAEGGKIPGVIISVPVSMEVLRRSKDAVTDDDVAEIVQKFMQEVEEGNFGTRLSTSSPVTDRKYLDAINLILSRENAEGPLRVSEGKIIFWDSLSGGTTNPENILYINYLARQLAQELSVPGVPVGSYFSDNPRDINQLVGLNLPRKSKNANYEGLVTLAQRAERRLRELRIFYEGEVDRDKGRSVLVQERAEILENIKTVLHVVPEIAGYTHRAGGVSDVVASLLKEGGGVGITLLYPVGTVLKQEFLSNFPDGEGLWRRLIERGWIKSNEEGTTAQLMAFPEALTDLGDPFAGQVTSIRDFLQQMENRYLTANGIKKLDRSLAIKFGGSGKERMVNFNVYEKVTEFNRKRVQVVYLQHPRYTWKLYPKFIEPKETAEEYKQMRRLGLVNEMTPADVHMYFHQLAFEQAVALSQGALKIDRALGLNADVIHAHDWVAGLVPAYMRLDADFQEKYDTVPVIATIHNLQYQGRFDSRLWPLTGIPVQNFAAFPYEFYGDINLLKGLIVFSDQKNTVSRRYAEETQTAEFGEKLEVVLKQEAKSNHYRGILNAVDYTVWDPRVDAYLKELGHQKGLNLNYGPEDLIGKLLVKAELQEIFGLPRDPIAFLFGAVGRLAEQKGFDLVADAAEQLLSEGAHVQFILLGTGDEEITARLKAVQAQYPDRFGLKVAFSDRLAHLVEAGADTFLMPSKYEPSGLNQMYSLRYGTPPIVRKVGGLADTINDGVTGFVFEGATSADLLTEMRRAFDRYKNSPDQWKAMMLEGMTKEFSWDKAWRQYLDMYTDAKVARIELTQSVSSPLLKSFTSRDQAEAELRTQAQGLELQFDSLEIREWVPTGQERAALTAALGAGIALPTVAVQTPDGEKILSYQPKAGVVAWDPGSYNYEIERMTADLGKIGATLGKAAKVGMTVGNMPYNVPGDGMYDLKAPYLSETPMVVTATGAYVYDYSQSSTFSFEKFYDRARLFDVFQGYKNKIFVEMLNRKRDKVASALDKAFRKEYFVARGIGGDVDRAVKYFQSAARTLNFLADQMNVTPSPEGGVKASIDVRMSPVYDTGFSNVDFYIHYGRQGQPWVTEKIDREMIIDHHEATDNSDERYTLQHIIEGEPGQYEATVLAVPSGVDPKPFIGKPELGPWLVWHGDKGGHNASFTIASSPVAGMETWDERQWAEHIQGLLDTADGSLREANLKFLLGLLRVSSNGRTLNSVIVVSANALDALTLGKTKMTAAESASRQGIIHQIRTAAMERIKTLTSERAVSSPVGASEDADDTIGSMIDHSQTPGSLAPVKAKTQELQDYAVEKGKVEDRDPYEEIISDSRVPGSSPMVIQGAEKKVGGIDLNPALLDLQIKRDGNGVPLPLPMQPIQDMHIEGFLPIIINITPVTNLPFLLGLADTEQDADEITPAMKAREPELMSALN